ncbi:MAG: N-acetylmuramoyl-L-alanine amidase [Elusimicrobia bacterium]|nr:N-acetylmuramoyl-L-alanine amidase [Elusimicrobiota bacterium]
MFGKLRKVLAGILLAVFAVGSVFAALDKVVYMRQDAYVGKIDSYVLQDAIYLDAAKTAKYLGGKIYWYPVSGKLLLQAKGKKAVVYIKTGSAIFEEEEAELANPLIVRARKAFLSVDFFTSKHFSNTFGLNLDFNPTTMTLALIENINVNSVNYFSYKDRTRVVIYMQEELEHQISIRSNNAVNISVLKGVISSPEKISVSDGIVKDIELIQENKFVKAQITMGENFADFKSFTLKSPPRLVFDIYGKTPAAAPPHSGGGSSPDVPDTGSIDSSVTLINPAGVESGLTASDTQEHEPPLYGLAVSSTTLEDSKSTAPLSVRIPDKIIVDKTSAKKVFIDSGHGGKDPGGRRIFGEKEKEINLLVAGELYDLLKKERIFDVLMSRTSDVFIPLAERCRMANDFKADIFISVHANASRSRKENGFEIYFMSEKASDPWAAEVADYENSAIRFEETVEEAFDPAALLLHSMARNEYMNEGSHLAGFIAREYEVLTPFKNRGVKQAAFYVLRGTYAPSILIEMGFMTNKRDQSNLNSKNAKKKIAKSVYNGLMKYAKSKGWK